MSHVYVAEHEGFRYIAIHMAYDMRVWGNLGVYSHAIAIKHQIRRLKPNRRNTANRKRYNTA